MDGLRDDANKAIAIKSIGHVDLIDQSRDGEHPFLCGCILNGGIDELGITGIQRQGFYYKTEGVEGHVSEHSHPEEEHIFLRNGSYDGGPERRYLNIKSNLLHGCTNKDRDYLGEWISIKTKSGTDKINLNFATHGEDNTQGINYKELLFVVTHNEEGADVFSLEGKGKEECKLFCDKLLKNSNRIFIEKKELGLDHTKNDMIDLL